MFWILGDWGRRILQSALFGDLPACATCVEVARVSALWSYRALAAALGLPATDGPEVTGVCIDSRRIGPGDLFVALPGDPGPRFQPSVRSDRDGHDFAQDAVEKGAAAVLVHRPGNYGAPALLVEDTLDALWALGRAARRRLRCPVVAVTGSSGKTTFKSFAAKALDGFATDGSLNNHIGVPLSLALTPPDAPAAVYEIGTNHPGEIEPLARLAAPDVAVVLNVHPAHIEHFGSVEAIRREKVSIAAGVAPGGAFVRPAHLAADHSGRTLTFGDSPEADVRNLGLRDEGRAVALLAGGERAECPVPGGGEHRAMSVCALGAVLRALGRSLGDLERLADAPVPRGRGNRLAAGGVTIIDESYNANPASMAATLTAFRDGEGARRIAVLGDMLELGEDAPRYHAELAPLCAGLHGVFCVGPKMRALHDALPAAIRLGCAERVDDAFVKACAEALAPGDRVLIKASNGIFWAAGFVERLAAALRAGPQSKVVARKR